jgi:hypothetical protein
MKSKFTILILFIGLISYCQSNVEYRDPVNQQDFETMLKSNNSSIVISKYKTKTINEITLIFKTETDSCNNNEVISLTLLSGEKLNFENSKITCTKSETKKYNLSGNLILTTELYNKLSQTEITEFNLGGITVPVNYLEKEEDLKGLFKLSESF